jgi:tetratricopeptide (TPR) repeat protein
MQRRSALVLFSLLFLTSSLCFSQGPTRKSLSGYIREEGSGHLITGARIELQNAMGTPIGSAYSDGNGAYEFDDIGGGDCYVLVQREGYDSFRQFVRPDGSGHVYKDVFLRPASPESKSKSINPVSEHQLSIPRKARESFDNGIQLIVEKSDYRGAVAQFAKAIDKYPSYYEAFAAMGLAQEKMGDAKAAEAALRKSVELSAEKYPQAMIDLASMFNGQKRFSEAEPLLRKVIALDASTWRGPFELAVALNGQNRFSEALTSASTARDLKPENAQVYLLLYNLHIHTDDFKAALGDTESYLKLTPDGATADRVRRMQEQVRKALQTSGSGPGPSSEVTPVAPPADSPVDAVSSAPRALSNFTPVDMAEVAPAAAPAADPAKVAAPVPATAPADSDIAPSPAAALSVAAPVLATSAANVPAQPNATAASARNAMIAPLMKEIVSDVAVDVPCSLPMILQGAGHRAEQLLNTLQKFDASERVEHYKLNAAGVPGAADFRSYDYVVSVSHDAQGGFQLQEYRNGGIVRAHQFPSGIITENLSEHGLIFHPLLASGFHFTCEGLGEWKGHPTWLVHFEEKPNQLNPFRSYVIGGFRYPVQLTGRAWIDARSYQVVRLESDLLKPIEKIHLVRDHISIEYASVHFRTRNEQLWLPQSADLYVELGGHRFYRRHSFTNFKIFSTDTAQEIHTPRESYCFTNTTELLISGVLNTTPMPGKTLQPLPVALTIPAMGTVCKSVGTGKDVNIPVEFLASATFAHDGPPGSVEADAFLPNNIALDVISNTNVPVSQNP